MKHDLDAPAPGGGSPPIRSVGPYRIAVSSDTHWGGIVECGPELTGRC